MKKLKVLIASMLGAIALVFACITGARVNAATELTYSFSHYGDTCYSNSECTSVHSKVSTVSSIDWYTKKTTSNTDLVLNCFASAARMNNTNGTIDRIGNDSTNAVMANVDSKYIPSNVDTETNTFGYVLVVKAVSNVKTVTISVNQTKKVALDYYLMVTSDNDTYQVVDTFNQTSGAASSKEYTINITSSNDKYYCAVGNGTPVEYGSTNSFGYAILLNGTKNLETTSWTTNITTETDQQLGEFHNVYYHDINGDILSGSDYAGKQAEEGATLDLAALPRVIGMENGVWKVGSSTGETADSNTTMGTEDIHLYASYSAKSGYTVADSNKLDNTLLTYAKDTENVGSSSLTSELIFGNTIFKLQKNVKLGTSSVTIAGRSFSTFVDTTGKIENATNGGVVVKAPSAGYVIAYIRSGSTSSDKKVNLFEENSTTAVGTQYTLKASNTSSATAERIVWPISSAGNYRVGGVDGKTYIYCVEFATETITTPVLEQQEDATGSNIRYIATIETTNIDVVTSWNATFTLEGKNNPFVTESYTVLYSAVTGNNGKAAATNTYYLVATLKNIPASFNGSKLTCKFTITLSDNTVVDSNKLEYTVAVTE